MKKIALIFALIFTAINAGAETWEYSSFEDELTSEKNFIAKLKSENTVNFDFPYSGKQNLKLIIRKSKKKVDIFFIIEKGQMLCSSISCTAIIRFDEESPINFDGNGPADHSSDTLFINNSKTFYEKLKKSKKLKFKTDFYRQGAPVFEFKTEGFNEELVKEPPTIKSNSTTSKNEKVIKTKVQPIKKTIIKINDLEKDTGQGEKEAKNILKNAILEDKGDLAIKLINSKAYDINAAFDTGETPLTTAIIKNNFIVVKALHEAGADLEMTNAHKVYPLYKARVLDHEEIVNYMQEYFDKKRAEKKKTK